MVSVCYFRFDGNVAVAELCAMGEIARWLSQFHSHACRFGANNNAIPHETHYPPANILTAQATKPIYFVPLVSNPVAYPMEEM